MVHGWRAGLVLAGASLVAVGAVGYSGVSPGRASTPQTAAERFGWGQPLPGSDEFNYAGAPDPTKWVTVSGCSRGHNGNGRRCASQTSVGGGYLRQSGTANGDTGWLGSRDNQLGGRWEARIRLVPEGGSGHRYHAVLLTWPQSDRWPQSGEYDFFEVDVGDRAATAFIHHPSPRSNQVQDVFNSRPVDLTQWHTFGFQWDPTAGTLTGYLDGSVWFVDRDRAAQAPEPMHGTIQLDNLYGAGMQPAHLDVDYYRIYAAP